MKDKRTKVLILITAAVGTLFLLDRGVTALVVDPWSTLSKEIVRTDAETQRAYQTLSGEEKVRRDWNKIRDRLDEPKTPDVHTSFLSHLGDLFQKVGVAFDVSENPQHQQQGDFREYIFETKFKLTWPQLVELLVELNNSREFLRPLKVSVISMYEKEDRLDVDLRLSTIEYSPTPAKAGPK
jgi:hypothetical protein